MRLMVLTALSVSLITSTALAAKPLGTIVRQTGRVAPPVAMTDPNQPACVPPSETDPAAQLRTIDAIEQGYPAEYRHAGRIGKTAIDPEEMRSLVTMFACVAAWPAAERRVMHMAMPLFVSRHGPEAFAMLDAIERDPDSDAHLRASARSFGSAMAFRVYRREPI